MHVHKYNEVYGHHYTNRSLDIIIIKYYKVIHVCRMPVFFSRLLPEVVFTQYTYMMV